MGDSTTGKAPPEPLNTRKGVTAEYLSIVDGQRRLSTPAVCPQAAVLAKGRAIRQSSVYSAVRQQTPKKAERPEPSQAIEIVIEILCSLV